MEYKNDTVHIWTDGSGNNRTHNNCGYGIVLKYKEHERYISGGQYINSTTARAEIYGALYALKAITDKTKRIHLYCDNEYVVKSWKEQWVLNWERESWIGRKNNDLWKQVLTEIRKFPEGYVVFEWCKGHQKDNVYNNLADKLAGIGAKFETLIDDKIV